MRPKEQILQFLQEKIQDNNCSLLDVGAGEDFVRNVFINTVSLDIRGKPDVKADAHFLPFKSTSFDYVIGISVIEHLENPAIAVREMLRVARIAVILWTDLTQHDMEANPEHKYCWTPKVSQQFLNMFDYQSKAEVWRDFALVGIIWK